MFTHRSIRGWLLAAFAAAVPLFVLAPAAPAHAEGTGCTQPVHDIAPGPGGVTISVVVACAVDEAVSLVLDAKSGDESVLKSETTADIAGMGSLSQRVFVKLPIDRVCITVQGQETCVPA